MKLIHLPPIAMAAGLVLLILSFVWPQTDDSDAVWSDEQARERSEAAAELHQLQQAHGEDEAKTHDESGHAAKLAKARQRYERSNALLESARSRRRWPATLLGWGGGLLALAGITAYCVFRTEWGSNLVGGE